MSTTTTNYKLIKPELTDAADITAMNPNWDTLDTKLKELSDELDDNTIETKVNAHIANKSNPHGVTAEQVGALPLTGGTINGSLKINDGGLSFTKGVVSSEIYGLNNSTKGEHHYLDISHVGDTALARLRLNVEENSELYNPNHLLQLRHEIIDGAANWYNVIHSGNIGNYAPKIQTGSYTGTGTYGSSNPNKLTFNFQPKLVVVAKNACDFDEKDHTFMVLPYGLASIKLSYGNYDFTNTLTWGTNTLSWDIGTGTTNATYRDDVQLNVSGELYRWVAIG